MNEPTQLALGIDKFHRNEYLFSDHYLDSILRRDPAWGAAQGPAADFLAWLRQRYVAEGDQLAAYNEAQLEENWIKPILGRLGHVWEPQASVPGLDKSIKKPDYVFFPDDDARKAAVADQRTEEYARRALAVGEVKAWPVSLSHKTAGAPTFANNNPMFQIDYYLKATGAAWGIVSNGRLWRLVHKDSSYRLDRYFEIDLLAALNAPDERGALAVATWFTLFFGRAAFVPDDTGRVFLDDVLKGSHTYAVALESDLRDNAYKALEQLILGFFAPAANGLNPADEADRAAVYRNSLLLLYRLLFLFFGESRGLLPMHNPGYADRSLTELARRAAKLVDDHKVDALPPMTGTYWARYKELFAIIDGRDAALNAFLGVPRYNGGLFDPTRHAFLENKVVGERHLVRAVDYLARRRKTESGQYVGFETVDYRTLGVRQLGSIYEGLLEYRVGVAAEKMVTVRKGGKETWLPARERGKTKVIETKQPGELYLATDKGERKATGSYYTPDYIVKYIVEQTLGPLVEEAKRKIRDTKYGIREEAARRLTEQTRFEEAILSLNVLDPAMGSGHFLVDATNYLARALATSEWGEGEKGRKGEGAISPSPLLPGSESDLTYWKRRVVEACIYGVDKNELAVELAKLSLWLETVAADKPLSFLDHHLRHGDSLIGARLADLERAPKPARPDRSRRPVRSGSAEMLFDESAFTTSAGLAVGGMAAIEAQPTDDLDTVHAKEEAFHIIHNTHLGRWRRLADLWTSAWFGNAMSAEEYRDLALRIQGKPEATMSDEQAARYLTHPAAAANDYFHWELEFPEVFFDQYGRPKGEKAGFDAVVGNPPYVRQEVLGESTKSFYQSNFSAVYHGAADIYVYFLALGIEKLRRGGRFSYICSGMFRKLAYGLPTRDYLVSNSRLDTVVDFGIRQVFEDATTYPIILIAEDRLPSSQDVITYIDASEPSVINLNLASERKVALPNLGEQWVFTSGTLQGIISSSDNYLPLSNLLSDSIFRGVTTGFNNAFVVDVETYRQLVMQDPKSTELLKPYIRGEDLRRWYHDNPNLYLIFTRRGTQIDHYPAIKAYLEQFRERLEPRPKDWDSSVAWPGRKPGNYEWFEIQDSVDYFQAFVNPRIHSTKISLYPTFSLNEDVLFASNTSYVLPIEDLEVGKFLLALLNSKLSFYYCRNVFAAKANGYYEVQPERLAAFPIPRHWRSIQLTELPKELSEIGIQSRDLLAVDLLAYLAQQMITLHQEKQTLTADFWTDLEGAADPTAFRKLRDKGKQEAGLAADPALAPFVRAESKSTRTLDESLAWDEAAFKGFVRALAGPVDGLSRLLRVHHTHAPRYRDLTDRIARTDHLIDQIVYKLYGLTDEEIAIVEGP